MSVRSRAQRLRLRHKPLFVATLAVLHCAAQAQSGAAAPNEASTLKEVTVSSEQDIGYAPSVGSTATKGSAPLRDIPQAVNVLPAQLLRDQGATSMQDALRNAPGVSFNAGDGQRDQVVIRGFTAIADWFVDGVRDDALYFRDLSDTERIEVLKGPAAVLYGRGSSGGLVNRVTKKPVFDRAFGDVTLGLGTHDFKRLTTDLNTPIGENMALRLNVAREKSGSYRDQQFIDRYNIAPSLAIKFSPQTDLLLQYTNAYDQRLTDFGIPALNGRPVNVPIGTYYGSAFGKRDDTTTTKVQSFTATLNHRFSDTLSLRNTTRYASYKLDRYNTLSSGTTDPVRLTVGRTRGFILRDESSWFNQTDLTWRNELGGFKQEWLVGAEFGQQDKRAYSVSSATGFERVSILNPMAAPGQIPLASYTASSAIPSNSRFQTAALYAQDQITLAPQWKALIGGRYDVFGQDTSFERSLAPLSRTDRKFSPRAGVVWQPSDTQSYYVSYSRSFQPSAETFALSTGNTANDPEITVNKEIGAKLDFLDGALNLTAAVFNLERSGIKNSDPANPARQINVGTQRTNGMELALAGKLPGRWDVSAGYAYLDGRMVKSLATVSSLQLPVGAPLPVQGKIAPLTPRHSAFVWLMKDLGNGLSAGGGVNYVAARYASLSNLVTLPSYVMADLAASYKTGRYEVSVNLKNISNRKYYVSAHGSVDNLIMPGPGRELQVALTAKF
ncbi:MULTISPECIES: TonB-dependent siderophore receptor [unclassified Variovorax]|uniref:TonB-dependent receptor n=1 Tax=unclassified Variovorax TaxID=663243 RepID=UPI0008AD0D28|nr:MULTISPECIES: TonB-dependent siderophore receptor [unclassified Variovorax]SEJ57739.1 catecholate siderophore receptor [Variovorax sp. OK202]SFC62695.1 catecholate siderophore receptor [Variovorax sp. OK212]